MDKEKLIAHTDRLSNYFRGLAESDDPNVKSNSFIWNLGLLLSIRLLNIAQSSEPDIDELRLLVKILKEEDFGSGWLELTWQAEAILKIIEVEHRKIA